MRYGLIGEKLGHSFSKIIHEQLADYTYDLIPLTKEELDIFMTEKQFSALNVTIPYKETVIPYLDEVNAHAMKIGAVNTIVNRDGKLTGYNTDFYGFRYMLQHNGIDVQNKKALVLGKGGASKAVIAVLEELGVKEILTVYYKENPETITYEECYQNHTDTEIIVNTTPVGMYPKADDCPIDLGRFPHLSGVADVVYNPLRTQLIIEAEKRGINAAGGLEMLVAQAKYAAEIFLDTKIEDNRIDEIHADLVKERSNLVLIGMSGGGKTSLGRKAAKKLGGWRLMNCTLYVTLEPCPMCAGLAVNARIPKVVFGAYDKKAGALGSLYDLNEGKLNHTFECIGGVLEQECAQILKDYFRAKRKEKQA